VDDDDEIEKIERRRRVTEGMREEVRKKRRD
jgi:hypothetical protein